MRQLMLVVSALAFAGGALCFALALFSDHQALGLASSMALGIAGAVIGLLAQIAAAVMKLSEQQ